MQTNSQRRGYRGKLKALVFDWAGTLIDYGSRAPMAVFVEVFRRAGVTISVDEARGPMGMAKRAHIEAVLAQSDVTARWRERHGRAATTADVDRLYDDFLPLQAACIAEHSELIPGVLPVIEDCRKRGLKIGTSTGYVRSLMDVVLAEAAKQGFTPDAMVCTDDVPAGRPAPWMCWENAKRLNVFPAAAMVKVDDTPVGIEAGLNAGMWTVGIAKTGNETGLSQAELRALPAGEQEQRLDRAYDRLRSVGAHYVIDGVADLLPSLDAIETRLATGEHP
jgi:phosphonoacetaldehyde hydrolase